MTKRHEAKYKIDRRMGQNIWGRPKSPINKREYGPGQHGQRRKGTPQFPMCGFSGQLVQILDYLGVAYTGLNVLENDDLRGGIKSYSNWPTIPQLYVKGEFVGGCDSVREMFQAGELQSLLKDKGIAVKESAQAS